MQLSSPSPPVALKRKFPTRTCYHGLFPNSRSCGHLLWLCSVRLVHLNRAGTMYNRLHAAKCPRPSLVSSFFVFVLLASCHHHLCLYYGNCCTQLRFHGSSAIVIHLLRRASRYHYSVKTLLFRRGSFDTAGATVELYPPTSTGFSACFFGRGCPCDVFWSPMPLCFLGAPKPHFVLALVGV